MKLCRVGPPGQERPCIVDAKGELRDLSGQIGDLNGEVLAPDVLASLRTLDLATLPLFDGPVRYGVPVSGTRQFVAIGLNFADHAAELNLPVPEEPVVFNKWVSCLNGANDPVTIPAGSNKTDWEVELGIVVGTAAHNVAEANALTHIAGYCVVNDVSERHWQLERGLTWDKGKGFPTFGPVGPWIVTADEIDDPQSLDMWLEVNGERVQNGNTRTMIFGVAKIIAYCSQIMRLMPGDIIATGTPPGVGMGQKPPRYLKPGDEMRLGITGLGEQRQRLVRA